MAIDELLDEHEQSERIRLWLRNNGVGLIGGVLLGLALIIGWQWWQKQQVQQRIDANLSYHTALKTIAGGDLDKARTQVGALTNSLYATLASLDLAKAQMDQDQPDAAIATLQAIKPADPALAELVELRLARLLIATDKPEKALAILDDANQPAALEARGDAQLALGQSSLARQDWSKALTQLEVGAPQRRLLELKLDSIGGVVEQPTPTS